ncbi:DUF3592 domain-containing protein [Hymenobacter swuensis]|uniref:DUF3592 domain-containing protein n=1 Tax=Hymenobacter swuensis TaxID=1446467 RepID=UPI0005C4A46A
MPALIMETILPLLAGASLFLWGLWLWRQRQRLVRTGQFVLGTIVGHDDGPIIQFHTQDQQPITAKPSASPSRRRHLNGASVGLYYNPDNPQEVVLDTTEHKFLPWLFMGMGAVFLMSSILFKGG